MWHNRAVIVYTGLALGSCGLVSWLLKRSQRRQFLHKRKGLSGYEQLIGNTPMIRLGSLSVITGCEILAKVEFLNPGGTGKDRIAVNMIREAEVGGKLGQEGRNTVLEGSSGSTGISLAALCRSRGYKCKVVLPDDQVEEKRTLLALFGAEVVQVRTASIASPDHYVNTARTLALKTPGGVFMDQFENAANFNAHHSFTGPEILQQALDMGHGRLDAFVMGAGTGGTIAGVSTYLNEAFTNLWRYKQKTRPRVVLVDPPGSSLYHKVKHGVCYCPEQAEKNIRRHRYDTFAEGIGLDRITANFEKAQVNDVFRVSDNAALRMAHILLRHESLFVGCSSAMNCVAACRTALDLGPGHTVVTILCDHGSRYKSRFWNEKFVTQFGRKWPLETETSVDGLREWMYDTEMIC